MIKNILLFYLDLYNLSKLIVENEHCNTFHALAAFCDKYFILRGRDLVKRIKRNCILCKWINAHHHHHHHQILDHYQIFEVIMLHQLLQILD